MAIHVGLDVRTAPVAGPGVRESEVGVTATEAWVASSEHQNVLEFGEPPRHRGGPGAVGVLPASVYDSRWAGSLSSVSNGTTTEDI
jgi:hypothetical protein